jgi:hypothetical protein
LGVSSRHFKLLVLLLPLFIARSLLPIGFMVSFDEGSARLVFCPSQVSLPKSSNDDPHAAHAAHHVEHLAHHGHHGSSDADEAKASADHQNCPFAFAAAAPLASVEIFAAVPVVGETVVDAHDIAVESDSSRAHPIRGPPAFS